MSKLALIGLIAFIIMNGCSDKSVDTIALVKNGTMEFDKTLTVGQVFDNYKHCSNKTWSSKTSQEGRRIVNFTCEDIEYMKKIIDIGSKKSLKLKLALELQKIVTTVEWAINVDNQGFVFLNGSYDVIWKDSYKKSAELSVMNLTHFYMNKPLFDNAKYDAEVFATSYEESNKEKFYAHLKEVADKDAAYKNALLLNGRTLEKFVNDQVINGGSRLNYAVPMPGRNGLFNMNTGALITDAEIETVASYVANGMKGEGADIFSGTCVACHGANGEGMAYVAPSLRKLPALK